MINIRSATFEDWPDIAELHARSWQQHYRGNFTDDYLNGPVYKDRAAVWRDRFTSMAPNMKVLLADQEGRLLGFACYFLDVDKDYGSLLDNLHVISEAQGLGVGKLLLVEAAANIKKESPAPKFYLYVLCENEAAIGFYEKLGGKNAGREVMQNPGGEGTSAVYKIAWPNGMNP